MGKGRAPCCDKYLMKKGSWSHEEDLRLISFIRKNGHRNWRALPKQAGLLRCGKSCRLRWKNYLSPNVKRGNFTTEEDGAIISLHDRYGNKWSKIASYLSGRTDNEIKNYWNSRLKKRLGIAPAPAPVKCAKRRVKNSNESFPVTTSFSSFSSTFVSSSEEMKGVRPRHEDREAWDEGSPVVKKFQPQETPVFKTDYQDEPKELLNKSSSSCTVTSSNHGDVSCLDEEDIKFLLGLGL